MMARHHHDTDVCAGDPLTGMTRRARQAAIMMACSLASTAPDGDQYLPTAPA